MTADRPGGASAAQTLGRPAPIALVVSAALVAMYLYGAIPHQNPVYSDWDLHDYIAMAGASPALAEGVREPFIFRILAPWIAGMLPVPVETGFLLITLLSGLALGLLMYFHSGARGAGAQAAAIAALLFLFNKYAFGFPVWNYYQAADLISLIEMVLLMRFMTAGKWIGFGVVLFLGALTKETTLIMAPVAIAFLIESGRFREGRWRAAGAILPACLAAAGLRLMLHPAGGNDPLQALILYSGKLLLPETWFRLLINAFIPVSLLPLIFFRSTREYFRTRKHELVFLALVLVSAFFGYNNERLMAPACLVICPLAGIILAGCFEGSPFLRVLVILIAALSAAHHTYARFPVPRESSIQVSGAAFAAVTLLALYVRRRSGAAAGEGSAITR